MLIDIHTHTPTHREPVAESERQLNDTWRPDRVVDAAFSWDDYHQALAPVTKACVFGIRLRGSDTGNAEEAGIDWFGNINDRTAEFVASDPDKLIGFMSVHPEDDDAIAEVQRSYSVLGLKGIKLGPNYQQFDPLDNRALNIYSAAQDLGIPILFHQGTSPIRSAPLRFAHPMVMDEIAIAFPRLRIVMAHMGHPWQIDTVTVIRKHPHVYADISAGFYRPWSFYNAMRLAVEWGVTDKLLFGSDYPLATPNETVAGLLEVNHVVAGTDLPRIPEADLEAILERDSLHLLGVID